MFGRLFRQVSEFVDRRVFGGQIKSNNILYKHLPAQISDALHYRSYDDDTGIFHNDESVGVVFEMIPLLGVDEKSFNMLDALMSRSVPAGMNLQVMSYSSPKIGTILDSFTYKPYAPHSIYNTVASHRSEHFEKGVWESLSKRSPFHLRYHRVFISASIMESDNPEAIRELTEFAETLENVVQQISSDYLKLGPKELLRLVSDILNPRSELRPCNDNYDASEDINYQIMSPDTRYTVKKKGVYMETVGKPFQMSKSESNQSYREEAYVARTLEARHFPKNVMFGDMTRALGDIFSGNTRHVAPVVMSLNMYYPNVGDAKALAKMKHMRATKNARSPIAVYMPEMKDKAADFDAAMESFARGAVPAQSRFQCTVFGKESEIDRAERSTRNLLTGIDFNMSSSDYVHFPALLFSLPMGMGGVTGKSFRRLKRLKSGTSEFFPMMAPLFGEWLGMGGPVVMFVGRCGQPYYFDNFSNVGAGNHNVAVMAESGGGKSVLLNEMVMGTCANGGHAVIFDDGFSFRNHCLLVGGKHYKFSLNDDFGLNVFDMIDYEKAAGDDEYRSMCIEMCKAVIIQMVFGQDLPTKEQGAIIEEAILSVMNKHQGGGSIDLVREYFLSINDSELESNTKSMAKSISTYCTGGVFGKFFNHKNTLDVTSHMTVFELSPLEQKPDLRAVILSSLLFMTDQKIVGDVSRRDLVVLDEAHKHIGNSNVCDVLQGWARRVRKYNGSLMVATQSARDFDISDDARAIFENCGWKIVLKTSTAGVEAAADMRVFPDEYSKRCAKNIYVSKGEYSEAVIIGGGGYSMGRLVLDPFTISLFTTTAQEVAAINELQESGLSLEDAIYQVSGVEPLVRRYELEAAE